MKKISYLIFIVLAFFAFSLSAQNKTAKVTKAKSKVKKKLKKKKLNVTLVYKGKKKKGTAVFTLGASQVGSACSKGETATQDVSQKTTCTAQGGGSMPLPEVYPCECSFQYNLTCNANGKFVALSRTTAICLPIIKDADTEKILERIFD